MLGKPGMSWWPQIHDCVSPAHPQTCSLSFLVCIFTSELSQGKSCAVLAFLRWGRWGWFQPPFVAWLGCKLHAECFSSFLPQGKLLMPFIPRVLSLQPTLASSSLPFLVAHFCYILLRVLEGFHWNIWTVFSVLRNDVNVSKSAWSTILRWPLLHLFETVNSTEGGWATYFFRIRNIALMELMSPAKKLLANNLATNSST